MVKLLIFFGLLLPLHGLTSDLRTIEKNILLEIMSSVPEEERSNWQTKELNEWMAKQNADGSFKGIDYIATDRPEWGALIQVSIAYNLLLAFKMPSHPYYQKKEILEAALKSLKFLSQKKWDHFNWWHREIGFPLVSYKLIILAKDLLPKEITGYLMDRTYLGHVIDHPSKWPASGQNNVWYSTITLGLAVIFHRYEWIDVAIKSIQKEFIIGQRNGLQSDLSFFQHGPVFYNGGYGLDFAVGMARFFHMLRGTSQGMTPENYDVLSSYILDGQLWLIHGKVMDFSSKGRYYCRKDSGNAEILKPACDMLADIKGPRQTEFKLCAQDLKGSNYPGKSGNKHFYRGDFMTHNRKKFSISVKIHSTRTLNGDTSPIGEGLKSHYLSDGLTYIHRSGEEYWNIYPVWDFMTLPGTTIRQTEQYPTVPLHEGHGQPNYWPEFAFKDFAGGVSDGDYGAATMDFKRGELQAKKAWFFGDEEMLALGTGITCKNCSEVRTGINQEWSDSKVMTRGNLVLANGVGYRVHQGDLKVSEKVHEGSWKSIAHALSPEKVEGKVLNIYLTHGKRPFDQSYAYSIFPATSEHYFFSKQDSAIILSNTKAVQAVKFPKEKMIQAIFYSSGKIEFDGGKSFISVNRPIAIMFKLNSSNELSLTVSAPDQMVSEAGLTFVLSGMGFGSEIIKFPEGQNKGKSLTMKVRM